MAERSLIRRIVAIFDREAAKKVETELAGSLELAGKKGGENFLRELRKQFDTKTADLKVALAKGVIDQKEFRRQSDLAAREFNAGLVKGLEGARQAGTLSEREYQKLSRSIKRVREEGETMFGRLRAAALRFGAAMLAAFSLRAIVNFGRAAVKAAADAEAAWTNLRGAVESTGQAFDEVEPKIQAAAEQFERLTTHDDDAFAETLQRLISITGDFAASLQNVLLVADVAARFFNGDLARAADVVGRAMLGDVEMLKRLGIEAKSAQEALDILAVRSFGAATDRAKTLAGRLEQLNAAWGNFQEAVGKALTTAGGGIGIISTLTATLRAMTPVVEENARVVGHLGSILRWLLEHVIGRLWSVTATGMATTLTLIASAFALAAKAASVFAGALGADTKAIDEFLVKAEEVRNALAKLALESAKNVITGVQLPELPEPPTPDRTQETPAVADTEGIVDKQKEAADETATVWGEAMKKLEEEANEQRAVLDELGEAWKRGGFAAVAALAKEKVKENLASALEMTAKALGALFFGNTAAAAAAAKSAALHTVAAGAWRAIAGGGGGGGEGAGGASGAALGAGSAAGLQRGETAQPPGTEVHIFMDPLDPRDPRVQEFHAETGRMVEERYGENATVTWHPRTGR